MSGIVWISYIPLGRKSAKSVWCTHKIIIIRLRWYCSIIRGCWNLIEDNCEINFSRSFNRRASSITMIRHWVSLYSNISIWSYNRACHTKFSFPNTIRASSRIRTALRIIATLILIWEVRPAHWDNCAGASISEKTSKRHAIT